MLKMTMSDNNPLTDDRRFDTGFLLVDLKCDQFYLVVNDGHKT